MKYLVILFAFFAISASAFADTYTGGTKTAQASFDCKVIEPLSWATMPAVTLEEVVAGVTRDIDDVNVIFTLTGENTMNGVVPYKVMITASEPTPLTGNPSNTVSLTGHWDATYPLEKALSSGTVTATYTVQTIVSTDAANDKGSYGFTLSVSAYYSNL